MSFQAQHLILALAVLGTISVGAGLAGALFDRIMEGLGFRSDWRRIPTAAFAAASMAMAAGILLSLTGLILRVGGWQAATPLIFLMAGAGALCLTLGAVRSCASFAGIRILPAPDQSCTAADHAVLAHYSAFNPALERCRRCGTFVNM
ncbi:MAG: hypothetical protein KC777_15845 [Cyanobacteria bacterium HKST-UBA02]|nr:hypothetical protein [Cyanobacteria bacterium HKST-UBA02]